MNRTSTPVDAVADDYLDRHAALDPIAATSWGLPGHDHELPPFDPDWFEERSQLRRRTLRALDGATPLDDTDRVTVDALRAELTVQEQIRATGHDEAQLNNLECPLQFVRDVFDLTPTASADQWHTVARRLRAVPTALHGYTQSLRLAASRGDVAPRRQVRAGIDQCGQNAGADGFFARFASSAAPEDGAELPESLRNDLRRGADLAGSAYQQLADFLTTELLPIAPDRDAVGREKYALFSQAFLGTAVDLDETYAWGQGELRRIAADMADTAARIKPGATVAEAVDLLDSDPDGMVGSVEALQRWMQHRSDEAIAALADVHFDIPAPIRRLECRIAPTQSGAIYYTGPSEDLVSRPGRMWWSIPAGVTRFSLWRELTSVYHEGVPGHHLQIAQTMLRRGTLNRWRRLGSWSSGHGEGWALYAERLMAELGFLADPGHHLGMLDAQSLRAARVVLDIGVHCDLPAPDEVGGGSWTYDKAWQFLTAHSNLGEDVLRFELDRYLGWPGQAPAYKVGERLWLALREEVRRRDGSAFDLREFHRRALTIGSVGIDVLRRAVLQAA